MAEHEHNRVAITNEVRRLIRSEIKRTGMTAIMLLSDAAVPADLTPREVNRWSSGLCKSARKSDLDYVVRAWAALPDRVATARSKRGRPHNTPALGRIEITNAMSEHLRSELERTWRDSKSILADQTDVPEGLTPRTIQNWLGNIARAKPEHWEFVLSLLGKLPDDNVSRTLR